MDDSLRIIQHLYGEEVDDPSFIRRFAEDEELREEYDSLKKTKSVLDQRSVPSPDEEVIDGIVDRAAAATSDIDDRRAADRTARGPDRSRMRSVRRGSAALAVILLVGLGWWFLPNGIGSAASTFTGSTSQETQSVSTAAETSQEAEALPEWDDRDDVVRLHRRIEQLQTRSQPNTWGGGLQPASQNRP